jgi:hypothetical protein
MFALFPRSGKSERRGRLPANYFASNRGDELGPRNFGTAPLAMFTYGNNIFLNGAPLPNTIQPLQ